MNLPLKIMRTQTIISCLFFVGGCTTLPPESKGGFDEHLQYQTENLSLNNQENGFSIFSKSAFAFETDTLMQDKILIKNEHRLRLGLELSQRHLDDLVQEGASFCFPATVVEAKRREKRVSRQIQAGLIQDAGNDLTVQRALLGRLEKQLDYVTQYKVCEPPKSTLKKPYTSNIEKNSSVDLFAYIEELLNCDNQFAFNSSEVNPKYRTKLVNAAKLLKSENNWRLNIIGHADEIGTPSYNDKLALERAQNVQQVLFEQKLPKKYINVDTHGENTPSWKGTLPEIRLVNRRVEIQIHHAIKNSIYSKTAPITINKYE